MHKLLLNHFYHKSINEQTMHAKALRLIKSFWLMFCFSVLLYATCKDIKRYLDNDDTTVIEFKRFNAHYWRMITGDSNATAEDIQNLTGFSSVTTSLEEILQSISTTNLNDMGVYWWHKKKHSNQTSSTPYYLAPTSHWPCYLSYQNP